MIPPITKEVSYTHSRSCIDIEDTVRTCLGGVGDRICLWVCLCWFALFLGYFCVLCFSVFEVIFTFSILVCRFLCLVICVLFRVCLVFILASFVICLFVGYFPVSVY